MSISVQEFAQHLISSGLLSSDDAKALWDLHASTQPFTTESFATALQTSGHLTAFQAKALQAEKCPLLVLGNYELKDMLGRDPDQFAQPLLDLPLAALTTVPTQKRPLHTPKCSGHTALLNNPPHLPSHRPRNHP